MSFYNVERDSFLDPITTRYEHPWLFFGLATAIPWALWFAAGYLSHRTEHAFLVDIAVIRPLFGVFAVLGLPLALLLGTALSLPLGYSPEQFLLRGGFTFTAGLVPVWIPLALAPILEELAWHGYGTDALVARWSVFKTSTIFAVIWALWHLPLASIKGYYQAEVVDTGWLSTVNFLVSIFPFMILMNWLYYRCERSIIVAIVFHLSANFGNEIFRTHPDTKAIQTVILLIVSGFVLWRDRKLFFSRPT